MRHPEPENISLEERYDKYSDEQIREILVKRKQYRQEALDVAINIAIERKIIHSEQDLLDPKFTDNESGFSFFPQISDAYLHKRFVAGMYRALYLVGLIPVVYGVMKHAEANLLISISGIIIGIVWMALTFGVHKKGLVFLIYGHFTILFLVFGFVLYLLSVLGAFNFIDVVVLLIGIGMPAYLLLYLKRIMENSSDKKE